MPRNTLLAFSFILCAWPTLTLAHGGVNDAELIIRITENGFEPKELTVVEGDTVLFINNDNTPHWPASNFHPTHTLYPEFDSLEGITPGGSWKMNFDKPGTWRMHDHLIPHLTGTIVVLEDPEKDASLAEAAPEGKSGSFWSRVKTFFLKLFRSPTSEAVDTAALERFKALDERGRYTQLEQIAAEEGAEKAWRYILAAYNSPEGVVGSAHDMAHLTGQLLFKEKGFGGLAVCTPVFAFGCYHGLVEIAFTGNSQSDYQKNILKAQAGCRKLGDDENPAYWSCVHGIGHGVITYRDHDAPSALKDCDVLPERVRNYCYDGIYMELSVSAPPNFYRQNEPLYPCSAVEEKYRSGCARAQARVMMSRLGMSFGAVAKACRESTSETVRYHCIDSLGYYAGQSGQSEPGKIIALCGEIGQEADRAQCLAAAAGELVFQNVAGWQEKTERVCESLGGARKSCDERVAAIKKSYDRK